MMTAEEEFRNWVAALPDGEIRLYDGRGYLCGLALFKAGRNAGLEAAAIVNEELCRAVSFKSTGALLKAANTIRALKTAETGQG